MKKLERDWKEVLADYTVPLDKFHAKEMVKSKKHVPMLFDLAKAISEQRKVYPIAWGIVVNDFFSFSLPQRRFMTGAKLLTRSKKLVTSGCPEKPYFVPFQNVIRTVTDNAPVGGKAHFFCGLDRTFSGYATALFEQLEEGIRSGHNPWSRWKSRDRLGSMTFPLARETAQLQAADLLVHLAYLHMCEWNLKGRVANPSGLLQMCLRNKMFSDQARYLDKQSIQETLNVSHQNWGDWELAS